MNSSAEQVGILLDYGINPGLAMDLVSRGQFVPFRRSTAQWITSHEADALLEAAPKRKRSASFITMVKRAQAAGIGVKSISVTDAGMVLTLETDGSADTAGGDAEETVDELRRLI